jgi:hypothetical protein
VFGREGSGVAVASGGGLLARRMVGSKVGVCGMEAATWQVGRGPVAVFFSGVCLHAGQAAKRLRP